MPTYDYRCKACGQTFEHFQSMKDDPITTCLLCGKTGEVDRLISSAGIIFKGSGFYVTDNKSSSKSSESTGSSGSSSN
ncbi:FmdB family zinc ribbon protein [Leptospira dzoumogneensis]|uniref:Zinc ribbon domain-containing protein n=1 Tax=Leptospira dzoumogneensis TaxID=2484904 RepID=A0A4Z1A943_9LEPT|nr:FmdB family zinc ribbon protein [Leptospira dzoumogneensis]TGM96106.1 zinc ribbon domain-containing protein [Leptospira dzoumogneensis]